MELNNFLSNPYLVIDLKPELSCNDDFIEEYGFSLQQIYRLASENQILINIYAFESGRKNGFVDYCRFIANSAEEYMWYIELFKLPATRISSIRRACFFDCFLSSQGVTYESLINKGANKFDVLKSLSLVEQIEIFNAIGMRKNNIDGAIETLTQQYAYCLAVIIIIKSRADFDVNKDNLVALEDYLKHVDINNETLVKIFSLIRGVKTLLASPMLASMGGTYNLSPNSVRALSALEEQYRDSLFDEVILPSNDVYNNVRIRNNPNTGFKNLITQKFLTKIIKEKMQVVEIPNYIPEQKFSDYLKFIKEYRFKIQKQSDYLQAIADNPILDEKKLDLFEKYFGTQADIFSELKNYSTMLNGAAKTTLAAGAALFIAKPEENIGLYFLSNAVAGSITEGIVTERGIGRLYAYFMPNKCQLISDIRDLKKLVIS